MIWRKRQAIFFLCAVFLVVCCYYETIQKLLLQNPILTAMSYWILPAKSAASRARSDTSAQQNNVYEKQEQTNIVCKGWTKLAEEYRRCVLANFSKIPDGKLWDSIKDGIESCGPTIVKDALGFQWIVSAEKGFADYFVSKHTRIMRQKPCVLMVLGLGENVKAEEQLLSIVPHCKVYGADPLETTGVQFAKLGKFFPVTVSNSSGTAMANVLQNGSYVPKEVKSVELIEFIQNYASIRPAVIDHLWIDSEGTEYTFLSYFHNNVGELARNHVTVCQLSMEIHGHPAFYGVGFPDEWEAMMRTFFEESDFIFLWALTSVHVRLFAFNYKSPICVRRYCRHLC